MRPSEFLLSLLPLAWCGLASSQQGEPSKQSWPSTAVDAVQLLTILSELTLMSRNMRPELLQVNKDTAAEDLTIDVMTETHTLYTYAKRLEDTPPFNPGMETAVLGVAYVLWEKDTKDFFMRLDQSAGAFRNISAYSTDVFLTQLFALNEAASYFGRMFHAATPDLVNHIRWIEQSTTEEFRDLPVELVRELSQQQKAGRKMN